MNKNIMRGLTLAALTGGFTILGATAANAIDLPDLGGGDSGGILSGGGLLDLGGSGSGSLIDDLLVDVPVVVDGLNVGVLDNSGIANSGVTDGGLLGDGVQATTGTSTVDLLAALGIDTSAVTGADDLMTVVGVPVDASDTWLSLFGNQYNGLVVVPNLAATPAASVSDGVDGLIDAFITAPVSVSCSSVTVLSDYENECAGQPGDTGASTGGVLDGGLLGDPLGGGIIDGTLLDGELLSDANGDGQITIEDRDLSVLDGDTLGDGVGSDEGAQVDFDDADTAGYSDVTVIDSDSVDGLDLSQTWLSVLGGREGVVLVPDLTLDLEALTGGLISHELVKPIVIDCVTVTVLSDYARACSTDPTDPTDPTQPTDPTAPVTPVVPGDGAENGSGTTGGDAGTPGITDPCAVAPTSAVVQQSQQAGAGSIAAAAAAGAIAAMGLMLLGRRMGRLQ